MAGTLVVSLPSAHTGGELVVDHAGESETYRASKEKLTFVVFYASCRHEVTPVRSGYRVALTFNLLADREADAQVAGPAADLAHCLTEHFTAPVTRLYGGADAGPPNRLVYLLDHEYTQRSLNWNRLKGVDARRAALLRAAADQAGCEAVLALAEVKETWDAWPSDENPWDDYDYHEDEDDEENHDGASRDLGGNHDGYQLNDLIDDEITLGWWTSPDGTGGECKHRSLRVDEHREAAGARDVSRAGNHAGPRVGRLLDVGVDVGRAEVDEPVVGHVGGHAGTAGHEPANGTAAHLGFGVVVSAAPAPAEHRGIERLRLGDVRA